MSTIKIVAMEYTCRVCERSGPLHVSPLEREVDGEEAFVIESDGYHKIARTECDECQKRTTHVLTEER